MKQISIAILVGATILFSAFKAINVEQFKVMENYLVKAKSEKFEAIFKGLEAKIEFEETNLSSSQISASIDVASINTGNGMRNKHAMQGLESTKYPRISFVSSSIVKTGTGYEANGKLTIKDVTKEIKLPFTFVKNGNGGTFEGKFSVVPVEYNVTKGGTPDLFEIQLNIPVTK